MDYGFVVIWQFRLRPGTEAAFEAIYGPGGDWVRLFRTGEGFLATELNRSTTDRQVYLTLDYWTSEAAYDRFRKEHAAPYQALDAKCEALTESETAVGKFSRAAPGELSPVPPEPSQAG